MKKLIPILSLAVLSSCTNTTQLNTSLNPSQDTITEALNMPQATLLKPSNTKKVTGKLSTSKLAQGIASWYGKQFHGKNSDWRIIRHECNDCGT